MSDPYDAAVIGGSFAGITAAIYLARARRRVVLFDDGLTRNRFAPAGHGFFGLEGRSPADMRMAGLAGLAGYPSATVIAARVTGARAQADGFVLHHAERETLARTVILAHGMTDHLPDLPGLQDLWGVTAVHCPYCHGYELADLPTGILMSTGTPDEYARLLGDWTDDLILFANGNALEGDERAHLDRLGVRVEPGLVAGFQGQDGRLSAVVMEDGRRVLRQVLYLAPRSAPSGDLARQLGCAHDEGAHGSHVRVDDGQATSVPGVFAAGDVCRAVHAAALAAGDGVRAGVAAHRHLLGL